MDDEYNDILNRGWSEMSKSLDHNLPLKTNKFHFKSRYYYTAALVLLLIGSMMISVNNSTSFFDKFSNNHISIVDSSENKNHKTNPKENEFLNSDINTDAINTNELNEITINGYSQNTNNIIKPKKIDIIQENQENRIIDLENSTGEDNFNNYTVNNQLNNSQYPDFGKNKKIKHNTISISVNSINENFASIGGFDGGINYSYKMNNKIGFMAGIEHSIFSKSRIDYELDNSSNNIPIPVQRAETNNSELAGADENIQDKLYYVGIPLGVMYSFNKFTLSAGVKVSYLLNNIYDENQNSDIVRNNNLSSISLSDNYQNQSIYNKFDYSFILGFQYQVLKNVSVFSKLNLAYYNILNSNYYEQGNLSDYYIASDLNDNSSKEKKDRNIYFGFGVKYDIKKK
ncbi:MAG: hypothetical protein R2771_01730 [Saprospiraceae bacterium]